MCLRSLHVFDKAGNVFPYCKAFVLILPVRFVTEDDALTEEQINGILNAKPDLDGDGLVTSMDVTAILKRKETL